MTTLAPPSHFPFTQYSSDSDFLSRSDRDEIISFLTAAKPQVTDKDELSKIESIISRLAKPTAEERYFPEPFFECIDGYVKQFCGDVKVPKETHHKPQAVLHRDILEKLDTFASWAHIDLSSPKILSNLVCYFGATFAREGTSSTQQLSDEDKEPAQKFEKFLTLLDVDVTSLPLRASLAQNFKRILFSIARPQETVVSMVNAKQYYDLMFKHIEEAAKDKYPDDLKAGLKEMYALHFEDKKYPLPSSIETFYQELQELYDAFSKGSHCDPDAIFVFQAMEWIRLVLRGQCELE